MISKNFLINLTRSRGRLGCCRAEFDKAGLVFERIEAVDGLDLTLDDVDAIYDWNESDYYKELTNAELACFLSHRKAWQKIVDDDLPFALIFEDDIVVSSQTPEAISAIAKLDIDWDYIKLAEFPVKRDVVVSTEVYGDVQTFELVIYNKVPNRTCAQAISYRGAKKLLAATEQITRPVDIDMQYWWEKNLNIYGLKPYPIRVNIRQPSTIDENDMRKEAKRSSIRQIVSKFRFIQANKKALSKRLKALGKS